MRRLLFLITLLPLSAHAVRLSADLSSGKASATCDWNTSLGKITAPMSSNGTALDFGDASEGDCNLSGTLTAREYKCRNITIASNVRFTGTTAVILRATGHVTISATVSVDGNAGALGNQTSPTAILVQGGTAGPAGFDGGDFDNTIFADPKDGDSYLASAARGSLGGVAPGTGGGDRNGGGGGGGGGFKTAGAAGQNGVANVGGNEGSGGAASATEAAVTENDFDTTLIGGAGGGSGGSGDEFSSTTIYYPGTGGGGGGALQITAAGNITITASGIVTANGGAGGNALSLGAGGGGGAGGAIFLQSGSQLTNNGVIRALGGAGGTVTSGTAEKGGAGGAGGNGRIRLDAKAGMISGNAATPAAVNFTVGYVVAACTATSSAFDTIGVLNRFRAGETVETLNGGTLTVQVQDSVDGVAWNGLVALSSINTLSKRYLRFSISLTPAGVASSPELDAINVTYDVLEKSTHEFKSDVSCGSVDMNGPGGPGSGPLMLFVGLLVALFSRRSWRKRSI